MTAPSHYARANCISGVPKRFGIPSDQLPYTESTTGDHSVFAVGTRPLETVVRSLRDGGRVGRPVWRTAARQPFFGLADRILERSIPQGVDQSAWWDGLMHSLGESIRLSDPDGGC